MRYFSFIIRTPTNGNNPLSRFTVGIGISPIRGRKINYDLRRLYCRWGISPRPKEFNFYGFIIYS